MKPKEINTTALAFMGDGVYEVYVRKRLMDRGQVKADLLHREAVKYVRASAQAKAIRALMADFLTEEEEAVARRGRNHKASASKKSKKNANPVEDKLATAFEALIGYLFLSEEKERMEQVIEKAFEIIERED